MRNGRFSGLCRLALHTLTALMLVRGASAGTYAVLYTFNGGSDGSDPRGNLIFDKAGNLYGTTSANGAASTCSPGGNCGTVFQLKLTPTGWNETTIYDFCSLPNCSDGAGPQSGLIVDSAGNLYGTTLWGGNAGCGSGLEVQGVALTALAVAPFSKFLVGA